MTRVPVIVRSAGVYAASNILQRAIPVLLLPVLARHLGAAELGSIAVFMALSSVVTPLVGLNISYAIQRRYFSLDEGELPAYLASCLRLLVAGTGGVLAVAWLASDPIQAITGLDTPWILIAIVHASAQVFMLVPLTIWQVEHRAVRYGAVQVGRAVVQAATTVVLVVPLDLGWHGAAGAMAIASVGASLVVGLPAAWTWIRTRSRREHALHAARYGGSLIPHTLGGLAITSADRFFMRHFAGPADTGLYFAGYQVGYAVALAADALNRAWTPWLYARLEKNDPDADRQIVAFVYLAFLGFALLALLVALSAPIAIDLLLTPELSRSREVVACIAAGFAFNGMYRVVSGFVFFAERTAVLSWITAATAVVNALLNVILIPIHGAIGAAEAQAAAFFSSFVLTFLAGARARKMPWLAPRL